ncbi:MAG TPA: hypothetical protein VFM39_00640 [bacterium]|nr:hypothetical protein [bacterium]
MMKLQERLFGAPATVVGHKRASSSITAPDRSFDLGWDMSRAAGNPPTRARAFRSGKFLLSNILKQGRQGPVEDLAEIPIWNLVTQKGLRLTNLLLQLLACRELYFEDLGR